MFGISNTYTINLTFLDYSPDTHLMRFRVRTKPKISIILRGIIRMNLKSNFPFVTLSGNILKIDLGKIGVGKFLKGIQMKNGTISINIKRR